MKLGLWTSVPALLIAVVAVGTAMAGEATPPASQPPATSAPPNPSPVGSAGKPTATAPTVAEVKPASAAQQAATRCNTEADNKKLSGDARKAFLADCLKAH